VQQAICAPIYDASPCVYVDLYEAISGKPYVGNLKLTGSILWVITKVVRIQVFRYSEDHAR